MISKLKVYKVDQYSSAEQGKIYSYIQVSVHANVFHRYGEHCNTYYITCD